MAEPRTHQAYVEDASSDDEVVLDRRRSPNSQEPNVAAKRSHPSDLNTTEKSTDKVGIDVASDSGYSSHTAATVGSADSAQSSKSQSPPVERRVPQPPPSPSIRRRPTDSPRKPLSRTTSTSRRPKEEECRDPNCSECRASQGQRRRRPQPSPLDSGLDLNCPPFDARSQRSDPSQYTPTSPSAARRPPSYTQNSYVNGSTIVTPASSGRRRSSSVSRPTSYHGEPPQGYWVPGMPYPTPPQERGPPPSMSAHWNVFGATPPNQMYSPGFPPHQISPPYDNQRPSLPTRNSSQYSARGTRPISSFGQPMKPTISYEQQPNQSSSNISTRQPLPSARQPDPRMLQQSTFESSSEEEEESSEEEGPRVARARARRDRELMPPPEFKGSASQRRPSLHRRPHTTQVIDPRMTQSGILPERDRESKLSRTSTAVPSRSSSIRRPSLVQPSKATSYDSSRANARVIVESPRDRRRQSYMGHETQDQLQEQHRRSAVYYNEVPQTRRRQTDVDGRRRDENVIKAKHRQSMSQNLDSAEAHMRQTRGNFAPEVTEQDVKSARRTSRILPAGSESGSTRSKHSDKASRVSRAQTSVTNSQNGEIRLRVDASSGANIQMNGDMEGRTISLNPSSDGMVDVVIGGPNGTETAYRNERTSQMGRRAIMPRRDAEESSVRSRRSSQSRRGGDLDRERDLHRNRRRLEESHGF